MIRVLLNTTVNILSLRKVGLYSVENTSDLSIKLEKPETWRERISCIVEC
jgi:hypothetical protein